MEVNLDGVFYCCQAEARFTLKAGRGKIINMASICACDVPSTAAGILQCIKSGCEAQLTRSLAAERAPRGVNVNCISPGLMETPLTCVEEIMVYRDKFNEATLMGRVGDVSDIVGTAIYLASPFSGFTTGHDLLIDGGYTLW